MNHSEYSETVFYRIFREHFPRQTENLYLTICGIEQCTPDKEINDRLRDGYHLHIVMSGEGVLEADGRRAILQAGQMFLVKPGERISYRPVVTNPWAYCWMAFDGERAGEYMLKAGFDKGVYHLDAHVDTSLFYNLCEKVLSASQQDYSAALKRLGLLMEFIALAIESNERGHTHNVRREHKALYKKKDYIRYGAEYMLNYYASINVGDVSKYLGIDRSYFSAIFKESMGIAPNEYLLQVRMRNCGYLLQNMDMSIQEVARYVGYEDSLTFSKAFRRFYGVSPKYYREMPADQRPDLEAIIAARRHNTTRE